MSIARIMQQAAAGAAGEALAIEDVFSTYLYTGNGSTQTITNGIDLAGEGGLVWIKSRSAATSNFLFDTERGTTDEINSDTTDAEASLANSLTAFNADGFSISSATGIGVNAATYASWTFRQARRFFDVVTYTGTGANRTIAHALGVVPGCIMVKRTDSTGDWIVYHRSNTANPETDYLELNDTAATADDNTMWNDTAPTSTEFTVGTDADVNGSTNTYVAYLFAHDPLGPSGDGSDGLIACGSFSHNFSGAEVNLGWEPQWILFKAADQSNNWYIFDAMRGIVTGGSGGDGDAALFPNLSNAENINTWGVDLTSTGFIVYGNNILSSGNAVYIAIRRGPMRAPTSGTEVFAPVTYTGDGLASKQIVTTFPPDMVWPKNRVGSDSYAWTRMQGLNGLDMAATSAEASLTNRLTSWNQNGVTLGTAQPNNSGESYVLQGFRRAPGFFDVVVYTGTGSARTVSHNLGAVPELMIVKNRSDATGRAWAVYANNDNTDYLVLNTNAATADDAAYWNDTSPTASVFTVGTSNSTNESGDTFIAYLFATLPGISKVGSYTGNGSSQTINCGFTSGARFVLIKRTDSTGDWLVGDTARGIVAGNDPYLELNTTAAEDTDEDWLDPDSSGFIVNETSTANANVSSATYIYLAIA